MGGISTWRDAAEFMLLGATSVQICTAVMHYGFRIIEDLCDGLSHWMDSKGFRTIDEFVGASLPRISDFNGFDLSFRAVARIDPQKCIQCELCYVACNDAAHQCIDLIGRGDGKRPLPVVREDDCVGCRLCHNVCPVEDCIEMIEAPPKMAPVTWAQLTSERPDVTENWDAMVRFRQEAGIDIH
jgi:dihydropyrimidine dehydrogenase (NAD+) subunit PreA